MPMQKATHFAASVQPNATLVLNVHTETLFSVLVPLECLYTEFAGCKDFAGSLQKFVERFSRGSTVLRLELLF